MPKLKKPLTTKEVEHIISLSFDHLFEKLTKILMTKSDLEEIKAYLIEIKTEMRMIRYLYSFWAKQNLSPEFMEQFLKEFDLDSPTPSKRMN